MAISVSFARMHSGKRYEFVGACPFNRICSDREKFSIFDREIFSAGTAYTINLLILSLILKNKKGVKKLRNSHNFLTPIGPS